jgi:hypothetical protein
MLVHRAPNAGRFLAGRVLTCHGTMPSPLHPECAAARRAVLAVSVALIVTACGTATPSRTSPPRSTTAVVASTPNETASPTPNPAAARLAGWLFADTSQAVFLQWTQTGQELSGSLTASIASGTRLQPEVYSFTGVVSGSSVSLTFSSLAVPAWNGTLNANQLVLSYPASDGSLQTLTFTPGTVADYNQAVAQLVSAQPSAVSQVAPSIFECSLRLLGYDAFVGVYGPLGSWAYDGCVHIADVVSLAGANWGPATFVTLANPVPANDSVVCGGALAVDVPPHAPASLAPGPSAGWGVVDDHVVVFDSSGQYYGGLICSALPLTIAYLGIRYEAVPGGLELMSSTGPNGSPLPAVAPGSPADRAGLQQGRHRHVDRRYGRSHA